MIRILCFGDSNTWGYISGSDHKRYNENERWTRLLQQYLGADFEIIEEGLNSRTLFSEDPRPGKSGRSGFQYLKPCIETHDKFDILILMLGTNELKNIFNNTPQDILEMLDKFVKYILDYKSLNDGSRIKLIVSGIPLVADGEINSDPNDKYFGASKKSQIVCELFKNYCEKNEIIYIDNTDLSVGVDCIHLTQESHQKLAEKLSKVVLEIYEK